MDLPKGIATLCALFALVAGLAGCGGGVPGNAVADMAGNPITTQAFQHWMYVAAASNAAQAPGSPMIVASDPPDFNGCIAQVRHQLPAFAKKSTAELRRDCKQLFQSTSPTVMNFLITGYWIQAQAAREHIQVSDADVQKEFQVEKAQAYPNEAQFQNFLKQSGQTLQDILFRVRISLIQRKLLRKLSGNVTPAQIRAYYYSHLGQFGRPETRDIRIVLTKTRAQAVAAEAALRKGKSWKDVAAKYSIDPTTKSTGGLLPRVARGQQDIALEKVAFGAPVNQLMGPVKAQFGYYVFEVVKVTKPTQQSLAAVTSAIRQQLTSLSQNGAQAQLVALTKKNWLPKTKCRAEYAMNDCAGYKPPKTTTAPTP